MRFVGKNDKFFLSCFSCGPLKYRFMSSSGKKIIYYYYYYNSFFFFVPVYVNLSPTPRAYAKHSDDVYACSKDHGQRLAYVSMYYTNNRCHRLAGFVSRRQVA